MHNSQNVDKLILLFKKQVWTPMPGCNSCDSDLVESSIKTTNVRNKDNPHAYSIYKKNRFRSENMINAVVVLWIIRNRAIAH